MPRHNRRPRRDNRPVVYDTSTPDLTPQQLAQRLVHLGLVSSAALGPVSQPWSKAGRETTDHEVAS